MDFLIWYPLIFIKIKQMDEKKDDEKKTLPVVVENIDRLYLRNKVKDFYIKKAEMLMDQNFLDMTISLFILKIHKCIIQELVDYWRDKRFHVVEYDEIYRIRDDVKKEDLENYLLAISWDVQYK